MPKPSETEFCPNADDSYLAFMKLLPRGTAWQTEDFTPEKDSILKKFMGAIGLSWSHFEAAMCQSLDQWFCQSASVDVPMWERDYGIPDECDLYNANVCAKVSASGSPTADYLMDLLAQNGYVGAGRWLKGNDLQYPGVRSTFTVTLDPNLSPSLHAKTELDFYLGMVTSLGVADYSRLRCMLERYIPLHTAVEVEIAGDWDPAVHLGAKLKFWLNADDAAPTDISTWTDRIAAQVVSTVGADPHATRVVADSVLYVQLDGTMYFELAAPAGLPVGATQGHIFAVVYQDAAVADANTRAFISYGNATQSRTLQRRVDTGVNRLAAGQGAGNAAVVDTLTDFSAGPHIIEGIYSANIEGRIDGAATTPASVAAAPALNTVADILRVGTTAAAVPGATTKAVGKIRHIMITTALTADELYRLEGWLAWNSNAQLALPGDHPYANVRP